METRIDFTPDDEQKMKSAAVWGGFIAAASITVGLMSALSFVASIGEMPVMAEAPFSYFTWVAALFFNFCIPLVLGVFLWRSCAAFRRVATTDDDDPGNLLRGFRSLRAYFMTQGIIFIISIVGVLIMFTTQGLWFSQLLTGT